MMSRTNDIELNIDITHKTKFHFLQESVLANEQLIGVAEDCKKQK